MDDGVPTLEVGFAIDTGGSYQELVQLQQVMDSAEAKIVADAASIERATGNMLDLGGATASMRSFGNAATKEAQTAARELARVEKAGEALSRQLDRDAATFGKTRDEIRAMKVEAAALAAEQAGLTELAGRLRAQEQALFDAKFAATRKARFEAEAAAEAEERAAAQAVAARQAEANAIDRAAREHAELAAAVQGSHAAQMADAAAAERLRMATDPLYAATQRLNAEIAESTRLYHAGATAPAEYARQQEVLVGRLRDVERQQEVVNRGMGQVGTGGRLAGHHMQNLAFQFQDLSVQMVAAAGSSAPLKMGFMALMQQGMQIQGIMSQAGIGIRGVGAAFVSMSKSVLLATVTNPILLGIAAAIGVVAGSIALLTSAANKGADMKEYAKSLGLTAKEMRGLDNVTVTWGDTTKAVFQVAGRAIWGAIGPAVTSVWETMKEWAAWIFSGVKAAANFMIGAFVGGYRAIVATWGMFPAALGDLFTQAVNKAIEGVNWLIQKSVAGINWMVDQANKILPSFAQLSHVSAGPLGGIENQWAGAASRVGDVWRKEVGGAMQTDYVGNAGKAVGGAVIAQAIENAKKRYLDPEKAKTDKNAERLARENEAIEAQIRNLYALADAYKVSGAAALIAEARTKAESDAIKKRGDIEMFVDRQIRLAIAQRVVDAAKATAAQREQAEVQEAVNAAVAAGTVPAARAAEMVKDQIADLPLLAAIQAAQQRGLAEEAARATAALADQRAERERLRAAEEAAAFNKEMASGSNRLAELREEIRLIGAGTIERVRALATLRATQEAEEKFLDPARRAQYIAQQVEIAVTTERLTSAQEDYNDALYATADRWDAIAQNVQDAAQGMSDAFGSVGQAIGDMASVYATFHANRDRLDAEHKARVAEFAGDERKLNRENQLYALRSATMQVDAYGDMAAAAKGFFKEGTTGYQALQKAEQVFRAIQFALSVRAMAQDAAETVTSIAKSGARTAAHAVEAVVKAISSLPFPLNLAAGAATVAALASLGVSIAGSFGGSGSKPAPSNTGTGTVLGNTAAQSESLKNAIDALREVDTLTNSYARQMTGSLKSIDSQIGNFAAVLVRTGDINASGGVTEGFKSDTTGNLLKGIVTGGGLFTKIPIIGGIIGGIGSLLGSLFGSTTKVTGSGLFGGPQSLGSILSGGFNGQTFSDIEKTKKFLGIKTGTSYSTQYGSLDPTLSNQFTLILRSFSDAIKAAAGPLGVATSDVEARLNSFVFSIGKIDLKGLTGDQIQEKLTAVFGAAADNMANAAFPGIAQFQKVGEGAFETLVRVASTLEAVTTTLDLLGQSAQGMSMAAKLGLADQFDSVSDLNDAVNAYFEAFYTKEEQAAAKTAQMSRVFGSLGLAMPSTLAAFRQLVEAQDLTTAAGQATYATLLQLAPAFADLQSSMEGAKSAADILSERQDLERQLLELQGNTEAIRQLDLAKLDESNRALQLQIWAIQDAKEAAQAANELREAWKSVGDSLLDEVKRIRGLSDTTGANTFASLMGQFNAATNAARGGDMDAAKSLPQLSQALLTAAENAATSRQELDRIRAQTAASLEATYGLINSLGGSAATVSSAGLVNAGAVSQPGTMPVNDLLVDSLSARIDDLVDELAQMRADNNAGHAANAAANNKTAAILDRATAQSGGDALSVELAA